MATKKVMYVIIALFALAMIYRFAYIQNMRSSTPSNEDLTLIKVTDKQILTSTSGTDGSTSTSREYVIFTDKGVYQILDDYQALTNYGGMMKDSSYYVMTMPTLDFQYKGIIITFTKPK